MTMQHYAAKIVNIPIRCILFIHLFFTRFLHGGISKRKLPQMGRK